MKKYILKVFDGENLIFQLITDDLVEALDAADKYRNYTVKIFKTDGEKDTYDI